MSFYSEMKREDQLLLDNASCASQHKPIIDDDVVAEALYLNVIKPLRDEIERLKEFEYMYNDLCD